MVSSVHLSFYKYQGTGNDFIIIDNRQLFFPKNDTKLIAHLCDRRFGIGADGLILLENDNSTDFRMVYYNADGNEGSMCGNGGRCIVSFAAYLGIVKDSAKFNAVDGLHEATIDKGRVTLKMNNVVEIRQKPHYFFLNTGSPHHVQLINDLESYDVKQEGEKLRYGLYGQKGSNINFVAQKKENVFKIRTYERGVEDETLSCGTGVTAVAIAMHYSKNTSSETIAIDTEGGQLQVSFVERDGVYSDVHLTGPTEFVFKGEIKC